MKSSSLSMSAVLFCLPFCLSFLLAAPMRPAFAAAPEALPNGTLLIVRPDHTAPRVAVSMLVRAGAGDETSQNAGWRRLLAEAMLRAIHTDAAAPAPPTGESSTGGEAAGVLDFRAWEKRAEELGGRIGISVSDDVIEVYGTGDSANVGPLLELITSMALRPRLSDADVQAARERVLRRLDETETDVAIRASDALQSQLYRDASGAPIAYGLPTAGSRESIENLSAARLRELHAQFFVRSRFITAVAGDVDTATIRTIVGRGAPATPFSSPVRPTFTPQGNQPALAVKQMPTETAWVLVGYALSGLNAGDAPALRVLAASLSDSPRERLASRLLEGRPVLGGTDALAQDVQTQWAPRRFSGEMIVLAQTGPQSVDDTKNAILDEVRRLRETPLTARELEAAKNFARGTWATERESLRERAFQSALATALDAPPDETWPARIQAVTAADVQRAAQKHLSTYAVVLVMPRE